VECINQAVGMWGGTVGTLYGMSLQAEADFYLAEAKSGQGQWSEAVEFYGRSLEVNPGRVDCCMGWARALGKLGRWSEAAELYRQLWKTDEDSLPPQTMVFISNELFKLDAFSEAASCLEKVLKIHPNYPGALREQKNQYCYHAYSSWLMETVEGISDWHKADGLLTCPDWSTAAKLCQQFMNTDSRKNSLGTFREYVRTNLLLAEECWERRDTHNAKIVLQRTLESFGKYLPVSMVNSLIKSVDTIRGNQINSSEELTKNIQNQICAINADVFSLDEWLCLYDVLNWNGLFQCGLVARQKGTQQAYQQAYSKLNNAESLRIGAMAAIDRADFKIADKYIDRLSAIGFNGQKFAELRAYKCLQEGDLKGFRKLWPYQAKSVDVLFQQYIRGKSVAVVGPAPTGVADGEEINSFDVVIRFNYRGLDSMPDAREYGTKTNISLYNAHTIRYLIAQNKLGVLSELDFCLIRRPRYDLDSLGWDKNKIRLIYESDNIFYKSLNGVPAVLFDVLLQGAGKVKLFKSNFYLASQQHSEKYRGRDEANFAGFPLRKIQPVVANHDLISQISFTRNLWKAGVIVVDEECAEVLKLSDESYLCQMEKLLDNAGCFYSSIVKKRKEKFLLSVDVKQAVEKLEETLIHYEVDISFNQQNSAWLQNKVGNFLERQSKFDLALEKYNRAIEIDPNYHKFHKDKALAYFNLAKRKDGITACCQAIVLKQIDYILSQIKQEEKKNLYKGLVFISSLSKPLYGMNRSIVQIAPYLQEKHQIDLEFIETKRADFIIKLYEKFDQCGFLFFNSAASIIYLLEFPEIAKTLIKLNMPIFIYWHETDWTLSKLKEKYPTCADLISNFSSQYVFHLTVSDECSNSVSKLMPMSKSRIYKVHNSTSIDSKVLSDIPITKIPPIVLNIASIQERKGTDLFIETAIKVCQKHPTVKFVWLGKKGNIDNYNHQGWLSKIKAVGLSDRITFPGYVDNPLQYLTSATLFFLSSRDDPFPLTILEAMSCGKKIITFNVGGAPEAVGEDGILIKPFDTDLAAEAILASLNLPVSELANYSIQKRYLNLYTPEKFAIRLNSCIKEGLQRAKEWSSYELNQETRKPSFNHAVLPLNSPKECFIIGSGRSLLNLTDREKEYLNEHPYTLAMNRYLLFFEKIGVLPKAMFAADSHFPAPKLIFQTIQKIQYLGSDITYYLDEYYRKLFVIPPQESVWARKQRDKSFEQHGYVAPLGFDYSKLVFFKHQFAVYSGFSWAKTLKEPLYWFHTSLLTAINLANIIYPNCDIKLLGIDLQGPQSFYHEEIMKKPEMLDKHYNRSLKELGQHPTAVATTPDGRTMFDALNKIVPELEKLGTKLLCSNPSSKLVIDSICKYTPVIG
jgi:glycerophosphoryl diester phosphodiesterase